MTQMAFVKHGTGDVLPAEPEVDPEEVDETEIETDDEEEQK